MDLGVKIATTEDDELYQPLKLDFSEIGTRKSI